LLERDAQIAKGITLLVRFDSFRHDGDIECHVDLD
jgi:hypothetical protein